MALCEANRLNLPHSNTDSMLHFTCPLIPYKKTVAKLLLKNYIPLFLHIQEVPTFRDFWFQKVIMKCGDHEFLKMGPKKLESPLFEG